MSDVYSYVEQPSSVGQQSSVLNWDAFAQFMQRLIWKAASRKTAVEANEGSSKCVDWFSRSACERHFQIDFAYVG